MKADFFVIGAGVVGLCIARALKREYPSACVVVCDKEQQIAQHASGRNSGVLHAGFYYTQDSLKARFTQQGNQLWRAYCQDRGLAIRTCGKLVPARNEAELPVLKALYQRGIANGVPLSLITAKEAQNIEPSVHCFQSAIYSPTTASIDPGQVMKQLLDDARCEGVLVHLGEAFYRAKTSTHIQTNRDQYHVGCVINAAGLYADRIAKAFGVGHRYTILPFKGVYLLGSSDAQKLRTHVYPVPDMAQPFLGVHATLTVDGKVKLGPSAMPAFWREHYHGWAGFSLSECASIAARELSLLCHSNFNFRQHAWQELRMYSQRRLLAKAQSLVSGLCLGHFKQWGRTGIRAQLLDKKNRTLVNDFKVLRKMNTWHILNAVSPAFTCAMAFADDIVDQIQVSA